MTSFARKLKRKQLVLQRKQLMKQFKSSMKNFKLQIKCSSCDRPPNQEENIDNWHINQKSENIDLICTDCYEPAPEEKDHV